MARSSAWTISLGAHALLALAIAIALGGGHHHDVTPPPTRLVYVEPAAPPAALAARRGDPLAAPLAPPLSLNEHVANPPSVAPAVPTAMTTRPALSTDRHERRPSLVPPGVANVPPSRVSDAVPGVAAGTPAAATGATAGAALGSAHGMEGGTVGGLGDLPIALRDVAAPPELVTRVLPDYPPRARAMQIEGQVTLEIVLDRTGRVEDAVRVTRSVPALDAAAVAAVRQWRFRPARDRDGRTVRVMMEIPVRFILR